MRSPYALLSTPYSLRYNNVLVGEVWLCSGQSNMAFRTNEAVPEQRAAMTAKAATQPQVRLYDMKPRAETYQVEWPQEMLDSVNRLEYFRPATWQVADSAAADRFSAVGLAFGQALADSLGCPVGLIGNAVGGSTTEAWVDRHTLEWQFPAILNDWRKGDFGQQWARERADCNTRRATNPLQRHPYDPCYLYECAIAPLASYAIGGVVWYQGESNAHCVESHERLFRLLEQSWRGVWGAELPFCFVQLSSMDRPSWPRFRDSQRRLAAQLPRTYMAVCSDLGDSLNVHPRHKQEVGQRLARQALARVYGHACVASGPEVAGVAFEGGAALVSFRYGAGLRCADGAALRTFEVAHDDGLFSPARAVVLPDGRLRVWSDEVPEPRFVRYGWQPFTRANLVNADGLPASTFRSE